MRALALAQVMRKVGIREYLVPAPLAILGASAMPPQWSWQHRMARSLSHSVLLLSCLPGCCTGLLPLYPWQRASRSLQSSGHPPEMCSSLQGCWAGGQEGGGPSQGQGPHLPHSMWKQKPIPGSAQLHSTKYW